MPAAVSTIGTEQLDQRLQQGGAFQFWNVLPDTYSEGNSSSDRFASRWKRSAARHGA